MRSKIKTLRKQLSKTTDANVEKDKDKALELEQLRKLCYKYFTKPLAEILNGQISLIGRSSKGHRYSSDFKQIALNIYFLGPKVYKYLQTMLCLPSKRTLQNVIANWCIKSGCNEFIFTVIGAKMKNFTDEARECVLCIDEISLKSNLFYKIKDDEIVGFHETNNSKLPTPAQFALTLMVRGIFSKWKQQIGYIFVSTCGQNEMNNLLINTISLLQNNYCKVRAIISDLGSNFYKFANDIGITPDRPYFIINNEKIFYIFDPPHLMKATRNNFFKHHFKFNDYLIDKSHIQKFYDHDKTLPLRLAPKLTNKHMDPNNFDKMRVKYAVQVLSSTVAAALSTHMSFGALPAASLGTITFIEKMDKLFDMVNSSSFESSKLYNRPFKGEPYQLEFLEEILNLFKTIQVVSKSGKNVTKQIKSLLCWQITISSILNMWEHLGKRTLFTRRLNQDCLENFFGAVRQQCGNARTLHQFNFKGLSKNCFV